MRQPNLLVRGRVLAAVVAVFSAAAMAQPALAQSAPTGNVQPETRAAQALPSLAPLVESVKAAVVNVDVTAKVAGSRGMENPMERFFGGGRPNGNGRESIRQGAGSGFIVDPSGI